METTLAIFARRSIRKFAATPIPHDAIREILLSATQAPSAKNRQPWRFVVVENAAKTEMLQAMKKGFQREAQSPQLPDSAHYLTGAQHTLSIMAQAPVTVFVINPLSTMDAFPNSWESRFYDAANIQSVGACIQNMLLKATDMGYGSLWICDIFFAYEDICRWLGTQEQVVAAISFGVPAESPHARPRKDLDDLIQWRD